MFRKLIALSFLVLGGLACDLTGATVATPDPGVLQTAVAATLTAVAPTQPALIRMWMEANCFA